MLTRRTILTTGAASLAGTTIAKTLLGQDANPSSDAAPRTLPPASGPLPPGEPGRDYTPVVTPNVPTLPFKVVDGVKVFHLIAETVKHEFAPGLNAKCWGYNGRTPGPTIEAVEGDRVRIYVTNRLPEPTTRPLARRAASPTAWTASAGSRRSRSRRARRSRYEFTLRQHGTYMYHPHFDEMTQMALGMMGHVRHPPARAAAAPQRRSRLRADAQRVEDRPGHAPARPERDDRLQRADVQRQGLPRHGPAGRRSRASACASASETSGRWTTTRSTCTATTSSHRDRRRVRPAGRASSRRRRCSCRSAARASSSSSPTRPATGPCTAT